MLFLLLFSGFPSGFPRKILFPSLHMQDSLAKSGFPLLHMHGIPSQIVDSSIRNKCLPPVAEGFSTLERFEHSTGTRRFNYGLIGGN